MHHIYHTEGIILGSKNYGEASKYYYIFTRDLGMVIASASGVRKMSSKLRYILQDFTYVKIDLIESRHIYKVTSAGKTNILENITKDKDKFKIFYNISRLIRRLLPGIIPNETLFNDVLSNLVILEKAENKKDLPNLEAIIVLRILHNLGYIGEGLEIDNLLKSPFEESVLTKVGETRKNILREINKALKVTQL